ncbi:MAG: transcriptional repressor LexA [Bacillota bacterium]|jgi:repressor LexA
MLLHEKIKQRREELKMSQQELANLVGYKSRSSINKIEKGINDVGQSQIVIFAKALRTTPAYLMGWEDDNLDAFSIPNIEPMPQTEKKPLIGTIACGEPILAAENIEDYIDIPQYIRCDFVLRCKGDSMIGAHIYDGDIVCIHQQPEVENGEIAAVLIDDEATLKRFSRHGSIIILKAENPSFDDIVITENDGKEIRVIGKATHFISAVK